MTKPLHFKKAMKKNKMHCSTLEDAFVVQRGLHSLTPNSSFFWKPYVSSAVYVMRST